jgi:uncharacterized protein YuzE
MRATYDSSADAAYFYIADDIAPGSVAHTHQCEIENLKGMIHLDFDSEGRLLGIEVIGAGKCLPREFLRKIG